MHGKYESTLPSSRLEISATLPPTSTSFFALCLWPFAPLALSRFPPIPYPLPHLPHLHRTASGPPTSAATPAATPPPPSTASSSSAGSSTV